MQQIRRLFIVLLIAFVLPVLLAACAAPATDSPDDATEPAGEENPTEAAGGVDEITILTFVGPQVAEPLQRRAPDFTAKTGIKVNVVTVPNSDLYQKALTD